jgi:hypothetical protein
MSSISIKPVKRSKSFGAIIRLVSLTLPALVMPLFAARWQPSFDAGEFPGAVFHPETVIACSSGKPGDPPKITTVSEGPRPGLPADTALPEKIARAFYRAVRENTGNAKRARGPGLPISGENTGLPDSIPEPAAEPEGESDGETDGGTGRMEGEGWQLLGFIRDSEGIERRYFKEKESGKIVTVTNVPENFPANTDSTEGDNR